MKTFAVVDGHCDTLCALWHKGGTLFENEHVVSLKGLPRGGYAQFFAAFVDDASQAPFDDACQMIGIFHREIENNKDRMLQIETAADFEKAMAEGKMGAMLTIENGKALSGKLSNLQFFYEQGVRALTLTWNAANELGNGVMADGGGLTAFGRTVVREMNRLGMMVDVSHLSERGFWDVMECTEAPPMASHSNAKAICSHPRNLTDEQIRALSKAGGVIGLNVYPLFLTDEGGASLDDCLQHIEHIASVGGENCLGLGSDFDGFSGETVNGLACPADYPNLFQALQEKGFSDSFLQKIAHGNWVNYAKTVIK